MIAMVIISVFASALLDIHTDFFIALLFISTMIFLIIALILFVREIYFTRFFIEMKRKNNYVED